MNSPPAIDRALAIIAAYGSDAARWPGDDHAGVLAVAGEPAVAAALAEARALEILLESWARADTPLPPLDTAAMTALPQRQAPRGLPQRLQLWLGGGAIAAALAVILVLAVPGMIPNEPQGPQSNDAAAPSAAVTGNDSDVVFATVFTPTQDEEDLI